MSVKLAWMENCHPFQLAWFHFPLVPIVKNQVKNCLLKTQKCKTNENAHFRE